MEWRKILILGEGERSLVLSCARLKGQMNTKHAVALCPSLLQNCLKHRESVGPTGDITLWSLGILPVISLHTHTFFKNSNMVSLGKRVEVGGVMLTYTS